MTNIKPLYTFITNIIKPTNNKFQSRHLYRISTKNVFQSIHTIYLLLKLNSLGNISSYCDNLINILTALVCLYDTVIKYGVYI